MKIIFTVNIVLSIIIGCLMAVQVPMIEIPTTSAVAAIEKSYLRTDLNDKEKKDYDILKGHIIDNYRLASICRVNVWFGGLMLFALLLLNFIFIFRIYRKISKDKNIQPSATPDAQKPPRP